MWKKILNNNVAYDNFGYIKGDLCNRHYNGKLLLKRCDGIIDEYDTDTSCTCHMGHPPCSHCEHSRTFCPKCDWDGREEQLSTY